MAAKIQGGVVSTLGTLSAVASSASSVPILLANPNRKGASIQNDSTQVLYLRLGPKDVVASTTVYTVKMAAGAYYETPFGYLGDINGIWGAANGNAYVTEFT